MLIWIFHLRILEKIQTHKYRQFFSSAFIFQNKLQTACDKLQKDITMKQWLLLAMTTSCQIPFTLTRLEELMGCSRQKVKKLALTLEKKSS